MKASAWTDRLELLLHYKKPINNYLMEEFIMAITAGMVKELREMTGAGMMDCKKALTETNGDMDAAVEFLRKNGQAKAEKKAGRIAAEGIVKTVVRDDKAAAIVEVNSETDFVAKNDEFQGFVDAVVNQIADNAPADMDCIHGRGLGCRYIQDSKRRSC